MWSTNYLPEHPEQRLISEAVQGIAVYRMGDFFRNIAGTVTVQHGAGTEVGKRSIPGSFSGR